MIFDCRLLESSAIPTHHIFVAKVLTVRMDNSHSALAQSIEVIVGLRLQPLSDVAFLLTLSCAHVAVAGKVLARRIHR